MDVGWSNDVQNVLCRKGSSGSKSRNNHRLLALSVAICVSLILAFSGLVVRSQKAHAKEGKAIGSVEIIVDGTEAAKKQEEKEKKEREKKEKEKKEKGGSGQEEKEKGSETDKNKGQTEQNKGGEEYSKKIPHQESKPAAHNPNTSGKLAFTGDFEQAILFFLFPMMIASFILVYFARRRAYATGDSDDDGHSKKMFIGSVLISCALVVATAFMCIRAAHAQDVEHEEDNSATVETTSIIKTKEDGTIYEAGYNVKNNLPCKIRVLALTPPPEFNDWTKSSQNFEIQSGMSAQKTWDVIGNKLTPEMLKYIKDRKGSANFKYELTYEYDSIEVRWDANGGKIDGKDFFDEELPMFTRGTTPSITPSRDGKNFTGWNTKQDGSGDAVTNEYLQNHRYETSMSFFAQWKSKTYNVKYDLQGGTLAKQNPSTYEYGVGIPKLEIPVKTNHAFEGWFDKATGLKVEGISATETGDKELVAKWKFIDKAKYVVKHVLENADDNYFTPSDKDTETLEGKPGEQTKAIQKKFDNYTCEGVFQQEIKPDGSTVVEIRYKRNTIKITFKSNGHGTHNITRKGVKFGSLITEPENYTSRDGYKLTGWYKDQQCTQKWDFKVDRAPTGDLVLYSGWTNDEKAKGEIRHIDYDLDGGKYEEGKSNPSQYEEGKGVDSFNAPFKTGFVFVGWFDAKTGGNQITSISKTDKGDKFLYARWKDADSASYTVYHSFENENGDGYDVNEDLTQTIYSKAGLKTEAKSLDKKGYTAEAIEQQDIKADNSTSVTVKYKRNEYNVTFDNNGHGVAPANAKVKYKTLIPKPDDPKPADGLVFSGWYIDKECKKTPWSFKGYLMPSQDVKLYAKWVQPGQTYKITYFLHGGKEVTPNPKTYVQGVGVKSFNAPVRDGYIFAGWYDFAYAGDKVESISTTSAEDRYLHAYWIKNQGEVNYFVIHGKKEAGKNRYHIDKREDIEMMSGMPGEMTKAVAKNFEGFISPNNIKQKTIRNDSKTVIKIRYKRVKNSVIYDMNGHGSSPITESNVEFGTKLIKPNDPQSVDGHDFGGWFKDKKCTQKWDFDKDTMPANTLTLYAKWTKNASVERTITYHFDGGFELYPNPQTYKVGVGVQSFYDAFKAGYHFIGWFDQETGGRQITSIGKDENRDIHLYARYKKASHITYTVEHYKENLHNDEYSLVQDETEFVDAEEGEETDAIAKTFPGFEALDFKQEIVKGDNSTKIKIFYKRNRRTITFHMNGHGKQVPRMENIKFMATVAAPLDPKKVPGYKFKGWYFDREFTQKMNFDEYRMEDRDIELFAKWEATSVVSQPITYHLYGGQQNPDNPTQYEEGKGFASFKPATRAGFKFEGWYTAAVGGEKVERIGTSQTGPVVLHAHWTKVGEAVYYVSHGKQTIEGDKYEVDPNNGVEVLSGIPGEQTKAVKKTFEGFTVQPFTQESIKADGSTYIKIKYNRNSYKLTLDSNGHGAVNPKTKMIKFGAKIEKLDGPVTVDRFNFEGWYKDKDCTNKWDFDKDTMPAKEITLFAKWSPKGPETFQIKYELDGGKNSPNNPAQYKIGVGVSEFYEPIKVGYRFLGWYLADGTKIDKISSFDRGDKTLYAKWEKLIGPFYMVKHLFQNVDDDNFTLYDDGIEMKSGKTGEDTSASAKQVEGFKSDPIVQQKIKADSSTAVEVKYVRNINEVEFDVNGENVVAPKKYDGIKFGSHIKNPGDLKGTKNFIGWYKDKEGKNPWNFDGDTMPDKKLVLYAKWDVDASKYLKIEYDLDGGVQAPGNPDRYEKGVGVAEFKNPTKKGFQFDGWYDAKTGGNKVTSISATEAKDVKLYARWIANGEAKYYVHHYKQNVEDDNFTPLDPEVDTLSGTVGQMTKVKAKDISGFKGIVIAQKEIKAGDNTHVQVIYLRNKYNVTFDMNGESGQAPEDIKDVKFEAKINNPGAPKDISNTFLGWYKDKEGTQAFDFDKDTMPSSNLTLYAKWEIQKAGMYRLKFDPQGGVVKNPNPNFYEKDKGLDKFNPAERPGYTFLGWYTQPTGGEKVENIPVGSTGHKTFYAHWKGETGTSYVVKHLQQNVNDDNYTEVEDDQETLTGVTGEKTNAEAKDYLGFDKPEVEQKEIAADGSTTVEIKYNRKKFTVLFDTKGKKAGTKPSKEVKFGARVPNPGNLSAAGFRFDGWFKDKDANQYFDFDRETMPANDMTLYAGWSTARGGYSRILYVLNGGTLEYPNPQEYEEGVGIMHFNSPIRQGYIFDGWWDRNYKDRYDQIDVNQRGKKILYAKWKGDPNTKYSVRYYQQNVHNNAYTEVVGDRETQTGPTDELANPKLKEYPGFNLENDYKHPVIKADGSSVVHVRYKRKIYNVAFHQKLDPKANPRYEWNIRYGAKINEPKNLSEKGYHLLGFTKTQGGNDFWNFEKDTMPALEKERDDLHLYAKWEGNTYKIRFNQNGHHVKGNMPDQVVRYGDKTTLNSVQFTRRGCDFAGWKLKADGKTIDYSNRGEIFSLSEKHDDVINLYAEWKLQPSEFWMEGANAANASEPTALNTPGKKTMAEVMWDFDDIKAGVQKVWNEYRNYMNNDNFHLYTRIGNTGDKNDFVEFRPVNVGTHNNNGSYMTWQATHMMPYACNMNDQGYDASYGYGYTRVKYAFDAGGLFYNMFKQKFIDEAVPVTKNYTPSSNPSGNQNKYGIYRFWIAGYSELTGSCFNTGYKGAEGKQFQYWYNKGCSTYNYWMLKMTTRNGGTPIGAKYYGCWWLRTGNIFDKWTHRNVAANGDPGDISMNYRSLGVVPCFCI